MIGFDVTDVTAINIGNVGIGSIYVGGTKIWEDTPTPPVHDYEQDYFTTVAKGSGNISFVIPSDVSTSDFTSISYSTDNGSTWTTTNNEDNQAVTVTVSVSEDDKVLWKGTGGKIGDGNTQIIDCTGNFDVEGNIMSLLNGDNFYHSTFNTNYSSQFNSMFYHNTHLINAEDLVLPATTLASNCYQHMFQLCSSLTTAPALPATTLAAYCYAQMFQECPSLTTAPVLPATTLANNCYESIFNGCTSLTTAPELPATTLASGCYSNMFCWCSGLTSAPVLAATTLTDYCYEYMFFGCSNLSYIKMLATNINAGGCLDDWVNNVSATGTFVKNASMTTLPTGASGIPSGWTVEDDTPTPPVHDYELDYFTTVAKGSGNISFVIPSDVSTSDFTSISYSTDNGSTWTTTNNEDNQAVTVTVSVSEDDKVLWKGAGKKLYDNNDDKCYFSATVNHDVEGNIMSLLNGDNFYHSSFDTNYSSQFKLLFINDTYLIDASNLILPATTLTQYCYENMFGGCTSLVNAPALPATTLAESCYLYMFISCSSLTTAPALPATTLTQYCYHGMFQGCSALTTAPSLPATTLATYCYGTMFYGCTSLTTAPQLPATTLAQYCYESMFYGCTSLTTAPTLPATTLASNCYAHMFQGCTSLTTAPTLPATTVPAYAYQEMFANCASLTTAPALPATTLGQYCYQSTFNGCTSLTTAPALPATTLVNNCYSCMFMYCSALENTPTLSATTLADGCYEYLFYGDGNVDNITMLATDISAQGCLANWVGEVSATGTFVKNASMTTLPTGSDGIPDGWTVEDYTPNLLSSVTAE